MSIALSALVEDLAKRVAALEQLSAQPLPLNRRNMQRKAEGGRLRAAIERVVAQQPHATAKQVLKLLPTAPLERQIPPSVRTIQWHLTAIRAQRTALRL